MNAQEWQLEAEKDGGKVPCSRYGWDSASCAPVAFRFAEIVCEATGEQWDDNGPSLEALDNAMSLVVNDHDDVESIIREHGTAEDLDLLD